MGILWRRVEPNVRRGDLVERQILQEGRRARWQMPIALVSWQSRLDFPQDRRNPAVSSCGVRPMINLVSFGPGRMMGTRIHFMILSTSNVSYWSVRIACTVRQPAVFLLLGWVFAILLINRIVSWLEGMMFFVDRRLVRERGEPL